MRSEPSAAPGSVFPPLSMTASPSRAGVPVGKMMVLLSDYGVKSNLQKEDYLEALVSLHKVW